MTDKAGVTLDAVLADLQHQGLIGDTEFIKTSLLLMGSALQIQASIEAHFRKFNLSQSRYGVLLLLSQYPKRRWTSGTLAKTFGVSKPTVTVFVRALEKDKWIERTRSDDDGRVFFLTLSKIGKKRFDRLLPEHLTRVSHLFDGWSKEQHLDMQETALKISAEYKKFETTVATFPEWDGDTNG